MKTSVAIALIAIVLIGAFVWSLKTGIEKSEVVECNKLEDQSKVFPNWFATEWQVEMCKAHNIDLSAYQVKN